jgi:hypothetical protein
MDNPLTELYPLHELLILEYKLVPSFEDQFNAGSDLEEIDGYQNEVTLLVNPEDRRKTERKYSLRTQYGIQSISEPYGAYVNARLNHSGLNGQTDHPISGAN